MFDLSSAHIYSLILALVFILLIHLSFLGLYKNFKQYLLILVLFPFCLMGLTLFIPQIVLQVMAYIFTAVGIFLFFKKFSFFAQKLKTHFLKAKSENSLLFYLTIIFLLGFFMSATTLKSGANIQDSMVYHLAGPKEWALFLNGAKFNANNPITYTTSYFDYYYYHFFLILKPIFSFYVTSPQTTYEFLCYTVLLSAQIFCGTLGLIIVPVILLKLSSGLNTFKYLTIFYILGLRIFTWTWVLPKNDVYPFLAFLVGFLFMKDFDFKLDNKKQINQLFIFGICFGIGTAAKLTNAYIVLFSMILYTILNYKLLLDFFNLHQKVFIKLLFALSTGLFFGVLIFLLRNYLHTNNPFYPIAKFGFPNIFVSDYADRPELYSDPTTWAIAITKIKLHLVENPQIILLLILAFIYKMRVWAIFYFVMTIYMAKQTGPMYTFRMTSFFLFLNLIMYLHVAKKLNEKNWSLKLKYVPHFLILFVVVKSNLQPEKIVKYPYLYYFESVGVAIKDKVDFWDKLLKENLEYRADAKHVFSPKEEIFPYFSRFPFISQYDSVPEYRYNYFEK